MADVGLNANLSKTVVDQQSGLVAQHVNVVFEEVQALAVFLEGLTDDDLVALGYEAGDVATLRSAVGDMTELMNIYLGNAALPSAKDFRTFMRRIWGLGYVPV